MSYADIHHFKTNNNTGLVDDDGDTLNGWYYQIMQNSEVASSNLTGPYFSKLECETAATKEWEEAA